jgi:hypothetical protein
MGDGKRFHVIGLMTGKGLKKKAKRNIRYRSASEGLKLKIKRNEYYNYVS